MIHRRSDAAILAMNATLVTDRPIDPGRRVLRRLFETALEQGESSCADPIFHCHRAHIQFRNPSSRYALVGVFRRCGPWQCAARGYGASARSFVSIRSKPP